jgi:c-di-GMP-binding flagellar brake protein YcgR
VGFFSFLGFKRAPSPKQMKAMLPSIHQFVDVAVKNGPKGSICFENAGAKTFLTSTIPGMSAGQQVIFNYQTASGKYRFTAAVKSIADKQATFELPAKIDTVQKFAGAKKRTNVRIDTTMQVQWRYAPAGKIETEWQKGTLSDLSRTGSSLAVEREVKTGTIVELKISLGSETVATRADARRVDKIAGKDRYTVGLAFHPLKPEAEKAIVEFINRRQVDLRSRGLG